MMDTFWIQYIFIVASLTIYGSHGQNLRQCYTCEGTRCESQLGFTITNCTTALDNCVTIYDGYLLIKRACYSALNTTEKASCDDTTNKQCSKCDTDNCNSLGRVDHTCVQCSSVNNRTCLTSPASYTATRCLAPNYNGTPSCYIRSDGETTQRGCILTISELISCSENTTSLCSTCSTQGCNSYEFPVGRRQCYRGTAIDYCDVANDTCLVYNIYGTRQSCTNDVETSILDICNSKPNRCKQCNENGCNTKVNVSIKCRKCDQSSTDKNCVGTPAQSTLTNCVDGCATYIKNGTGSGATTHRSCYEDLSATLKAECLSGTGLCELCLDEDCNSKIFPKDRFHCYQCESAGCSATNLTSTVCELYSSTEKCLSVLKNGQPTEFTCLSGFNRTKSCANSSSCIVSECSSSGCNEPSVFEKSISCVQCNSTQLECTTAPHMVGAVPCRQPVDTCYSMLQGQHIMRGCLGDLNATQQTYCRANCDLCNSTSGCNNQIFPASRLFCHQCDSRVNSTCSDATTADPTVCVNYNTNNKCVALMTTAGVAIRACSSDQSTICNNTVACAVCDQNGCNNATIGTTTPTPTPATPTPSPSTPTPTPATPTPSPSTPTPTPATPTPSPSTPTPSPSTPTPTPATPTPSPSTPTSTPATPTPSPSTPTPTPATPTPSPSTPTPSPSTPTPTPATPTPSPSTPTPSPSTPTPTPATPTPSPSTTTTANPGGTGSVMSSVGVFMIIASTCFLFILNIN